MAEIKTPIERLPENEAYVAGANDYVITDQHTIADILRFLVHQAGGDEDILYMLEQGVEPQQVPTGHRKLH